MLGHGSRRCIFLNPALAVQKNTFLVEHRVAYLRLISLHPSQTFPEFFHQSWSCYNSLRFWFLRSQWYFRSGWRFRYFENINLGLLNCCLRVQWRGSLKRDVVEQLLFEKFFCTTHSTFEILGVEPGKKRGRGNGHNSEIRLF